MSLKRADVKSIVLCYIYNKENPAFWNNLLSYKKYFQEIIILNSSEHDFNSSEPDIRIINYNSQDFQNVFQDTFFNRKFKSDYLFILEENEKLIFNDTENFFEHIEGNVLNINIFPEKPAIFEYETEPFKTTEARIFSLKNKDSVEILKKLDLFYSETSPVINSELLHIQKENIDFDYEINKASIINNDELISRYDFFAGNACFYKDSIISEEHYLNVLKNEKSIYTNVSLMMLLKLLNRRLNFDKVLELTNNYSDDNKEDPLFYIYRGIALFETQEYRKALNHFHKALTYKDNIPFIYNYSDINWKIYKYIGEIFYQKKRFKQAEKYLLTANNILKDRKSPEIYLLLAKMKFKNYEYNEAYKFFEGFFKIENIPQKILKDAKTVFLNLLLFISFEDEFIEILSNEYFDNKNEILRLGDTYYMNEEFENALKLYQLVVQKFETDNQLLFKLGYICSRLKTLELACYYFEKFLETEPDNLDALNNIAFLYLNDEKTELAEKYYQKILKLNNFSFEANLYLAIIYMSRSEKNKAQRHLEKAKTLNPASHEIIKLYQIFKSEFN